jgi:hypothetical protein
VKDKNIFKENQEREIETFRMFLNSQRILFSPSNIFGPSGSSFIGRIFQLFGATDDDDEEDSNNEQRQRQGSPIRIPIIINAETLERIRNNNGNNTQQSNSNEGMLFN